jgi:hypothetical protein
MKRMILGPLARVALRHDGLSADVTHWRRSERSDALITGDGDARHQPDWTKCDHVAVHLDAMRQNAD